MFNKPLAVQDLYNFIANFNNNSVEHLLIWMTQFYIEHQLCLLELITNNRITKRKIVLCKETPVTKVHNMCLCKIVYDTLDSKFKKWIPLEMIQQCITNEVFSNNNTQAPPSTIVQLDNRIEYQKNINMNIKLEYLPVKIIKPSIFEVSTVTKKEIVQNKVTIHTVYLNRQNIKDILKDLNVCELFALYNMQMCISKRDYERLLPEYWRSFQRSVYEKKIISNRQLIGSIYNYHTISLVLQADTKVKATFKLSCVETINTKNWNQLNDNYDTYLVQPNLNGFRLVISKTSVDNNIYVRNSHGFKVRLSQNLISNQLNNAPAFTGEFIALPYKNGKYMHAKYYDNECQLQLIMVDIFIWNSKNLISNLSYEDRYEIMQEFLKDITTISSIKNVKLSQIPNIIEQYKAELRKCTPHFNGLVYKKKIDKQYYQKLIYKYKFPITRFDIFKRAGSTQIIIDQNSDQPMITINTGCALTKSSNGGYSANFIAYLNDTTDNLKSNKINLAIFDKYRYILLQTIILPYKLYICGIGEQIIINDRNNAKLQRWFVLKINFHNIKYNDDNKYCYINNITDVQVKYDASLLDCVSLDYLYKLFPPSNLIT